MKNSDIVAMVESLPVDIKTVLLKKILESLNPSQEDIDKLWAREAEKRLKAYKSGTTQAISGADVFRKAKGKYRK